MVKASILAFLVQQPFSQIFAASLTMGQINLYMDIKMLDILNNILLLFHSKNCFHQWRCMSISLPLSETFTI